VETPHIQALQLACWSSTTVCCASWTCRSRLPFP